MALTTSIVPCAFCMRCPLATSAAEAAAGLAGGAADGAAGASGSKSLTMAIPLTSGGMPSLTFMQPSGASHTILHSGFGHLSAVGCAHLKVHFGCLQTSMQSMSGHVTLQDGLWQTVLHSPHSELPQCLSGQTTSHCGLTHVSLQPDLFMDEASMSGQRVWHSGFRHSGEHSCSHDGSVQLYLHNGMQCSLAHPQGAFLYFPAVRKLRLAALLHFPHCS